MRNKGGQRLTLGLLGGLAYLMVLVAHDWRRPPAVAPAFIAKEPVSSVVPWVLPTPFVDLRGEVVAIGAMRWVLVDTMLVGMVIIPEIRAQGTFALAEFDVENLGAGPAVFGIDAMLFADAAGHTYTIEPRMTALLAEEERRDNCLGQVLTAGKKLRCRVLFDFTPYQMNANQLFLRMTDLKPGTDDHVSIPLDFLGTEPAEDILGNDLDDLERAP